MSLSQRAHGRDAVSPRVSVVIPALNEARNLEVVLPALPQVHEVILVDGGSVDGTVAAARRVRPDVVTILQTGAGKGNAVAAGLAGVTGDLVVVLDADGSADPREIDRYVETLTSGADVAKGSRFVAHGWSADLGRLRAVAHRALGLAFRLAFGSRTTDVCYGYAAFWADLVPLLDLPDHAALPSGRSPKRWGDGAELETLMACRFAEAGVNVVDVPSVELARLYGSSRLRAVRDAARVLRTVVVEWTATKLGRRRPERVYTPERIARLVG